MLEMLALELSEASSGDVGTEEVGVPPVERSICFLTLEIFSMREASEKDCLDMMCVCVYGMSV